MKKIKYIIEESNKFKTHYVFHTLIIKEEEVGPILTEYYKNSKYIHTYYNLCNCIRHDL